MKYISLMATDDPQCIDPSGLRVAKKISCQAAVKAVTCANGGKVEQTIKNGRAEKRPQAQSEKTGGSQIGEAGIEGKFKVETKHICFKRRY